MQSLQVRTKGLSPLFGLVWAIALPTVVAVTIARGLPVEACRVRSPERLESAWWQWWHWTDRAWLGGRRFSHAERSEFRATLARSCR